MRDIPPKLKPAYYEPKRNEPCVCGSKVKFKMCCSGSYTSDAATRFRTAYNQGDYEQALTAARHHLTWYVLCYKAHTFPLLQMDALEGEMLLRVDINALAELLDNLYRCYYHLGRSSEFPAVIDKFHDLIDDYRWQGKIAYITGIWYLFDRRDEAAAFSALSAIDIETCSDWEVLSLYLQVCPTDLSLPASLDIIERIIADSASEAVRLQYRVLKAVKYYLVCQQDEGDRILYVSK